MTYPYIPTRWLITTPDLADDPDVCPFFAGQEYPAQKSPTFPPTIVRRSVSGREIRASLGDVPWWHFKLSYAVLRDRVTQPELDRLLGFFCNHNGQLGSFYYYDPFDNKVSNAIFGLGDGSTTTFQMSRDVAAGTVNNFSEPVYVLNGTPTVYVNGVATTGFTIGNFGSITFTAAPAGGAQLSWSGSFMFLCRFGTDQIDPAQMVSDLWSLDGLTFQSWIPL